jgi:hypothetical protein
VADHLDIDLEALAALARDLQTLHTDVSSGGAGTTGDGIGSPRLQKAVTAFADDWAIARGRMLESIAAVGAMAEGAATTFTQAEDELAAVLTPGDAAVVA